MLHSVFRRPADPRIWPLMGLTLWLASCTTTAVHFALPNDHPAHPDAQAADVGDRPSVLGAVATEFVAQPDAAGSEVVDHSQHQMKQAEEMDHSQHQMKQAEETDHSQHQMKKDQGEHQHSEEKEDREDHGHSGSGGGDGS